MMKYYSSFNMLILSSPSLHIIRTLDTMVTDRQSQDLVSVFKKLKILYHNSSQPATIYIPQDPKLLKKSGFFSFQVLITNLQLAPA